MVNRTTTGGHVTIGATNTNITGGNPWGDGDNLKFLHSHIFLTTSAPVVIGEIDVYQKNDVYAFRVKHDASINSVISSASNPESLRRLETHIYDGVTLTLTGNNMDRMGPISFVETGDSMLNIAADGVTLPQRMRLYGDNTASIFVNGNTSFNERVGYGSNALKLMIIGENKTATLNANYTLSQIINEVTLGNNATLEIRENTYFRSNNINANNAGNGTLSFAGAATITGAPMDNLDIGNSDSLANINIGAGAVTFYTTDSLVASATNLTTDISAIIFDSAVTVTTNFTNTSGTDGNGNLTFLEAAIITGNVGASSAALSSVDIGDGAVDFVDATSFYATNTNFTDTNAAIRFRNAVTATTDFRNTSGTDGNGDLTFEAAIIVGDIGASGAALYQVNFYEDTTVTGDVYASTVNASKTATFHGNVTSGNLTLEANATVTFDGANSVVNAPILFTNHHDGAVILHGTKSVLQNIGTYPQSAESVEFTNINNAVTEVGANLYAKNITISDQKLQATANISLVGSTSMTGSTLSFGTNIITFENGYSTGMGDITFNTTFNGTSIGHIVIDGDESSLDIRDDATITVHITSDSDALEDGQSFPLFELHNGATIINIPTINADDTNPDHIWTQDDLNLIFTRRNAAEETPINTLLAVTPPVNDCLNYVPALGEHDLPEPLDFS